MARIRPAVVKELKKRRTGSLRSLARTVDMPVATLSDVINERHAHVSAATCKRLAQRLGLTRRSDYKGISMKAATHARADALRRKWGLTWDGLLQWLMQGRG